MQTSTFLSSVGNRPFPMWDVRLQKGDTINTFVEIFNKWHTDQGGPRFFRVTVYVHTGALLIQTTIEGVAELEIFLNTLLLAIALEAAK